MHIKLKTKSAICVFVSIVSFLLLMVTGLVMLGGEFFSWVTKGFHYTYYFLFERAFNYKTALVLVVVLLTLAGLVYWFMFAFKSKTLKLHEMIAPITTVMLPFIILSAIRGNTLGIWSRDEKFLVVLAIISLVIYSLASCGTLFYFYKTTYKVVFNKNAKVVEEVNEKATEAQEEVIYEKGEPIYNRDFVKVILERMEKAGEKLQETEVDEALEKVREEKQFNRIVKIAVRPEAFEVDKSGFVSVDVSNIEHIGRDVSVVGHVSKQNNKVRILIPSELSNQLTSNQLHFSPKKYYVFETSGKRLK